jgi:hypothetical protein
VGVWFVSVRGNVAPCALAGRCRDEAADRLRASMGDVSEMAAELMVVGRRAPSRRAAVVSVGRRG